MDTVQQKNFDSLTGVSNRDYFMELLGKACSKAERFNRHFALLYLDMDNFTEVNDNYGLAAGDKALQVLAAQLNLSARSYDTIARLDDDKFIVLLEELEGDGLLSAIRIAKRIMERLEASVVEVGSLRLSISASIGISLFPQNSTDKEQLIELAAMAMFVAKRSGGGYHLAEIIYHEERSAGAMWKSIN